MLYLFITDTDCVITNLSVSPWLRILSILPLILELKCVFPLQKLQSELDALRSSLGDLSRRCVSFFEEKSTSTSVPVLRSELNQAVEKLDKLHNLSSVYLEK